MKKLLVLIFAAGLFPACNSNPQQTGSDIIMEKERHDNPIEYQTDSITLPKQSAGADSITPAPNDSFHLSKDKKDSAK